ncbi:hypothetical protein [Halolamina salifodinae]|uniref:Uncharacterized protein n=1 Tax=Halolamina salifodinae TaxID=1202767 RepID=A0A8T4H0N6_9EURY|nr:hypothetical protein [Halolamina salifodinae]MBP1987145.1 hypothetical protein [Halolamina salifodinae]
MPQGSPDASRRRFLGSIGAGIAVLGGLRSAVGTARGADPVRPAEYRWDLHPEREEARRSTLSEYVDDVGPLVEEHPAFEYDTERAGDDHGIDFAALDLFRERNYEQYAEQWQMDRIVEAFDDPDAFETAKTERFYAAREDAPRNWDQEAWRNADSFGESLDYAHSLLISIDHNLRDSRFGSFTAMLREAYRRYHPAYEPLAWTFRMDTDIFATSRAKGWVGLVYSSTADELRAFVLQPDRRIGTGGSRQLHPRIENWPVTDDPDGDRGYMSPNNLAHPLLFHTEGWSRRWSFPTAKTRATQMVSHIATDPVRSHYDREGRVEITTGFLTQLTRTLLTYNDNDAEFAHLRQLSKVMELARELGGSYVVDLPPGSDGYDGVFGGDFAVYEVGYDYVLDLVARDGERQFDTFGETYGLDADATGTQQGPASRREGW